MSDNKHLRGQPDRSKFNKHEVYEVEYAVNELKEQFPAISRSAIQKAVIESANVKEFHENRKMIINSAIMKLENL